MTLKQIDTVTWKDTEPIPEGGSRGWPVTFYDTDGKAVTPKTGTLKWTLTDTLGNLINEKENQSITSAETVLFILSGADCAVQSGEKGSILQRVLTIIFQYDSVDLGPNQPGRVELRFKIKNMVGIK